MIKRTYKISVSQLFMLFVRQLVNTRLLAVQFWGVKGYGHGFSCTGVSTPNPCVVEDQL